MIMTDRIISCFTLIFEKHCSESVIKGWICRITSDLSWNMNLIRSQERILLGLAEALKK